MNVSKWYLAAICGAPDIVVHYVPKAVTDIRNLGVRCGSVAAAGKRILRVCFREITPDSLRQI